MNDLISREQALNLLNLNKPNVDEKTKYAMWQFDKDLQTIKTMPSVEKTGRWINGKCSECGCQPLRKVICQGKWIYESSYKFNYCPSCGARMKSE